MTEFFESRGLDDSPMRLNGTPTSAAAAARLYSQQRSRRGSFGSEGELISFSDNEVQSDYSDISHQVSSISKKLSEMEEMASLTNDERGRLKTENALLTERVHVLEEQLEATEQRYKDLLVEEKARARDLIARTEREKALEVEGCQLKYQVLEKDLQSVRREKERLATECTQLRDQVDDLKSELADSSLLCEDLEEERMKIEKQYKKFKEEAQQDIDSSSEMVEELSRQTEELRRRSDGPRQGSMADQMLSLEEELERMRMECRELRENNDELQAQLLHASVASGQSLLEDAGPSLLEEMNGKDSSELLDALREQEVCNQKLRVYINGILMRVIERHPEILEIKDIGEDAST